MLPFTRQEAAGEEDEEEEEAAGVGTLQEQL